MASPANDNPNFDRLRSPHGTPLPPALQENTQWQHEHALLRRQLMQQWLLRADWGSKPQPEPMTENAAPLERSTSWSKATSWILKGGMQKVMESGEYSDLTILCKDRKFAVHKVVVCSQSKVLAAAMRKGFKESELNVIDLSADDITLVSKLVTFLYTGNYPAMADDICAEASSTVDEFGHALPDWERFAQLEEHANPKDHLTEGWTAHTSRAALACSEANLKVVTAKQPPDYSLHVEMYALSDQYDIPALGALAKDKLDVTCMLNWNPKSFIEFVPHVYEWTLESNQDLRTMILEHTRRHSNEIMKDELLKASFHGLLATTPEFGTALLNSYMTDSPPSPSQDMVCRGCGREWNRPHAYWCEGWGKKFCG